MLHEGETDEVQQEEVEAAEQPVAGYTLDRKSFTSLAEAWGGRVCGHERRGYAAAV